MLQSLRQKIGLSMAYNTLHKVFQRRKTEKVQDIALEPQQQLQKAVEKLLEHEVLIIGSAVFEGVPEIYISHSPFCERLSTKVKFTQASDTPMGRVQVTGYFADFMGCVIHWTTHAFVEEA